MANRRGLGDLIKEEAKKTAAPAAESALTTVEAEVVASKESVSTDADSAEKDKTIAKLEQSLAKAKTDLEAAQKEVLRLIDENKQLRAAKPGSASRAWRIRSAPAARNSRRFMWAEISAKSAKVLLSLTATDSSSAKPPCVCPLAIRLSAIAERR